MRCAVIGAGAWGTALADLLARNGHAVCLWAREPDVVQTIGVRQENARFLPGVALSAGACGFGARVAVRRSIAPPRAADEIAWSNDARWNTPLSDQTRPWAIASICCGLLPRAAETIDLPELGVAVHGRSFPERVVTEDLVPSYREALAGRFNIGMLHTSLTGREGHDPYAPTDVPTLASRGYDYFALGHVHAREVVKESGPRIVYPGNLQGRHVGETGPKGCELVTVEGGRITAAEPIALDVVRWHALTLDVSGVNDIDALARAFHDACRTVLVGGADPSRADRSSTESGSVRRSRTRSIGCAPLESTDAETPSVECPIGDFFACGWGKYAQVSSLAICVNPGCAFNCYWVMPFRKSCRVTMENIADQEMTLYYQIDYTVDDVLDFQSKQMPTPVLMSDLEMCRLGRTTIFNFAAHRRPEAYGRITEQVGSEAPGVWAP